MINLQYNIYICHYSSINQKCALYLELTRNTVYLLKYKLTFNYYFFYFTIRAHLLRVRIHESLNCKTRWTSCPPGGGQNFLPPSL